MPILSSILPQLNPGVPRSMTKARCPVRPRAGSTVANTTTQSARPLPRYAQLADTLSTDKRLLDAARLMCWRAAWMADEGLPNAKEASMAKAYAAKVAMKVCTDAVQVMGAHGCEQRNFVEKWYRDIKVFDIFEGTGQIQRIVISKRILREAPNF